MIRRRLSFLAVGLSFFLSSAPIQAMDGDRDTPRTTKVKAVSAPMEVDSVSPYAIGLEGLRLYEEGNYPEAAHHLREALAQGDRTFVLYYADICHRNLDGVDHSLQEAAQYYVQAAAMGDGEALSYLESLSPDFLEESSEEDKTQKLVHIWAAQYADEGYDLYTRDQFVEAARSLERAARANHCLAQQLLGDICFLQLDEEPHSYLEAAMWYLLAARRGDPHSCAYLESLIPGILEIADHRIQMKSIVRYWVVQKTIFELPMLKTDHVNNYLVEKHGRKIDKTQAQKLPYLFERVMSALMFDLTGQAHSVIDDHLIPQAGAPEDLPEAQSCAQELHALESKRFVIPSLIPGSYGPVYFEYFKSLDKKLDATGLLKKPKKLPEISPLYAMILDALQFATEEHRAGDLSALSHRDYPWLLAGIKFWKEKRKRPFNFTSLSEEVLLQRLEGMSDPMSEADINSIRQKLEADESKGIWPNNDRSPICDEYDRLMRRFFTSPLSRNEGIVKTVVARFYETLGTYTSVDLDCSKPVDLEILRTPVLMFSCQKLTLTNVSSKKKEFYESLREGQRYFVDLELTVVRGANFSEKSKNGKNTLDLLDKIKARGIVVSIVSEAEDSSD